MSYLQFPAINKLKVIDASGEDLGAFECATDLGLRYIVLNLYIKGTVGGSERLRLRLYGNSRKRGVIKTSDWVSLSDIPDLNGGDWLGFLRFDFGGFPITGERYYHFDIETDNYTRNGDTFYLAAVCDYAAAHSVSNRVAANDIAIHMTVMGDAI